MEEVEADSESFSAQFSDSLKLENLTPGEVYALLTTERMILEHKLMSDKQVLSDLIRKRILKEHIEVQRMKESLELIQDTFDSLGKAETQVKEFKKKLNGFEELEKLFKARQRILTSLSLLRNIQSLKQSASLLGKKLQGKSGSTFQELLDLLTVCQDLMTPLLSHELVKKETELLLKEPVLKNPFIETPTTSLSILQPIIESFEKSKVILVEKCWIFIENGFSLTGKSLHALLDLQLACRIISALHKEEEIMTRYSVLQLRDFHQTHGQKLISNFVNEFSSVKNWFLLKSNMILKDHLGSFPEKWKLLNFFSKEFLSLLNKMMVDYLALEGIKLSSVSLLQLQKEIVDIEKYLFLKLNMKPGLLSDSLELYTDPLIEQYKKEMELFYQEIRKDFRVNPVQGGLFETALQLVHRIIQKYKEIMLLSRKRLFFEMMKVNVTIFGKYAKILEDKKRSLLAKPESPDITALLEALKKSANYLGTQLISDLQISWRKDAHEFYKESNELNFQGLKERFLMLSD